MLTGFAFNRKQLNARIRNTRQTSAFSRPLKTLPAPPGMDALWPTGPVDPFQPCTPVALDQYGRRLRRPLNARSRAGRWIILQWGREKAVLPGICYSEGDEREAAGPSFKAENSLPGRSPPPHGRPASWMTGISSTAVDQTRKTSLGCLC